MLTVDVMTDTWVVVVMDICWVVDTSVVVVVDNWVVVTVDVIGGTC